MQKYSGCWSLYIHPKTEKPVGCGYYYVITCGAMSHTAFRTKRALKLWLQNTGSKIGRRSYGKTVSLLGTYYRNTVMMDNRKFYNTFGHLEPFYALDNGDFTVGFIERAETGNILHIQNPNTDRPILDYMKISKHIETGTPARHIYKW